MTGIRDLAIHWYRKAFGAPAGSDIRDDGFDTVLDGNTAVAVSEAAIASHAVLGGTAPASQADSVWLREVERGGTNLFGETLSADAADGPRGIVAAATGLALAGRRATAFLSGPDVAAAQDLLLSAAGKHAPLVLHLGTRSATTHGSASGSGHDTAHLCADSGCFLLFANSVQQAVDFTFVARRVAEDALVPGIVVMDGAQTALAAQDVRLLSPAQIESFIGPARERVDAPNEAQKMLFGDTRRRLPAWHDLDEPMLTGALFDEQGFALGASANHAFFDDFVANSVERALEEFAGRTGREYSLLRTHHTRKAKTILVAQGAAVETAIVAADALREHHKLYVGVVGIQSLRPFPTQALREALAGKQQVFVLERADTPLSGEPPLTREIRAAISRIGNPPPCQPVIYGLGGLALRLQDLVALCADNSVPTTKPVFLGVAFDDNSGGQPKRAVMLDALRRAYPDAAELGIRAAADLAPSLGNDTIAIAVHRNAEGGQLARNAAALIYRLQGGRVRSRPAVDWPGVDSRRTDWLVCGDDNLLDPGEGLSPDVTLDVARRRITLHKDNEELLISVDEAKPVAEAFLGGLLAALVRVGFVDATARKISSARREMLDELDEDSRDALIDAFESGLGGLAESDSTITGDTSNRRRNDTPTAVRELGRSDNHVASLPRFWDQAGVLYRDGQAERLTADPYLATGTMPPLSSTFSDLDGSRDSLPLFDPTLCTGCGHCWTQCPDSAIGVVATGPSALIDAGIRKTGAEALRPIASKLAARIIASNKKAESPPATFGQMLDEAFAWLMEKAPLPDERRQAIETGVRQIVAEFGDLPVAVTQPFFKDPEAQQKDSAELLAIAINPDACKACDVCVRGCEPGALTTQPQDAAVLDDTRRLWELWSSTPDTPGTSIDRAAEHADVGQTAAMLLSRYCQFALAGGDPAEAGSGEKLAARLFLSATEYQRQPVVQRFAQSLADTGDELRALIHSTLSGALPDADLDAVAAKLEATSSPRIDLTTLAKDVTDATDQSIDTRYLKRLIELSGQVDAAREQLVTGKHGLGRARYGLAVSGSRTAAWAATFPRNPFQAPAVVDMSGAAGQLAAGLVEGHLDETAEMVRLLRLARLEIDRPDGFEWKRDALKSLHWHDLAPEELELCPPLILIGSDEMLAARGLSQLVWLLNSKLPVKVLVLSSLEMGLVEASVNDPRAGIGLLALAQRNAYVAQTSLAEPDHFGASVMQALAYDGPALVQVYAPSPSRDGYAIDGLVEQSHRAVAARTLPLFCYDPRAEGVFGSRISLEGNPQRDSLLVAEEDARVYTPVHWAFEQGRFAGHFEPLAQSAPSPLPIHEWLALDAAAQRGKTPYVASGEGDDEPRYAVSAAMLRAAGHCIDNWRTLQELAGVVTPFTRKLEEEIRAEVAAEHQAELNAQKQAAAAELKEVRQKTQAEIAATMRSRLLELATRQRK
jgi:pyruvate-ferredoxin/flavodoxin oxidoreductase